MRAYVKDILPIGVSQTAGNDVVFGEHVVNPSWAVSFLRWADRSPYDFLSQPESPNTKDLSLKPLIVDSDCISVSTSSQKTSMTPGATLILKNGFYNYLTAIAPGDFFTINIVPSSVQKDEIVKKIQNEQPINGILDGFKGLYKVSSVREAIHTDPSSGKKFQTVMIQGYGMAELVSKIYFVAQLFTEAQTRVGSQLWLQFWGDFNSAQQNGNDNNVQNLVLKLFTFLLLLNLKS